MKSYSPNLNDPDKNRRRDTLLTENIDKGAINSSFDISVLKEGPGPNNGKTPTFASIWGTGISIGLSPDFGDNYQIQDKNGNVYMILRKFIYDDTFPSEYIGLFNAKVDPGTISNPVPAGTLEIIANFSFIYIIIVKYSSDGEVLWVTYADLGGSVLLRQADYIPMIDSMNNLYLVFQNDKPVSYFNAAGKTEGIVNAPTPAGTIGSGFNIHTVKYNTQGEVQWAKTTILSFTYSPTISVKKLAHAFINSQDEIVIAFGTRSCIINTIITTSPGTVGTQNFYASFSFLVPGVFIHCISENGSCKWVTRIASANELELQNINIDNNNNINILFNITGFQTYISFYNPLNSNPSNPTFSGEITVAGTIITPATTNGYGTLGLASYDQNGTIRFGTILGSIRAPVTGPELPLIFPLSMSSDNSNIYIKFQIKTIINLLFFNAEPLSSGIVVDPISSGNITLPGIREYTILLRYDNNGRIKSFTYYTGINGLGAGNQDVDYFGARLEIPDKLNNSNLYIGVYRPRTILNPIDFFSSAPLNGISVQDPIPAGSIAPSNLDYSIMIKFNSGLVIQWASFVHELYNINRCFPSGIVVDSVGNLYFYGASIGSNANSNLGFYSPNIQGNVSTIQTLSISCPNPNSYSSTWIAKYNDVNGSVINGINTHFISGNYNSWWFIYNSFKATIYKDEIYSSFPSEQIPTTYYNHYDKTSVIDPVKDSAGSITLDTGGIYFLLVNKYGEMFTETPDYLIKPTYEINSSIGGRVKYIYNDLGYKVLIKTNGYVDNENTKPDLLFGEPGGAITLIPNNSEWTVSSELGFTFL